MSRPAPARPRRSPPWPETTVSDGLAADPEHLRIAIFAARRRVWDRPWLRDEAESVALVALVLAARTWCPAGAAKFPHYLRRAVKRAVGRHVVGMPSWRSIHGGPDDDGWESELIDPRLGPAALAANADEPTAGMQPWELFRALPKREAQAMRLLHGKRMTVAQAAAEMKLSRVMVNRLRSEAFVNAAAVLGVPLGRRKSSA